MGKYVVGYGKVKDDFTIEERELASFLYQNDAELFIRSHSDANDILSYHRVYYMDILEERKEPVRELYCREDGKLLTSDEVERKGGIIVAGYRVTATEEFEQDGEYDFSTEDCVCLSYAEAKRIEKKYIDEGYTEVSIDEDNISIKDFWGSEKFIKGTGCHQERTKTEAALENYKVFNHPGASIHEMIGTALESVDTRDMFEYFKDKMPGGESLIRNYIENQIVANEINKERYRHEERER